MPDLEKVLTWLEICGKNRDCSGNCPYSGPLYGEDDASRCREDLMADALVLLKEQEPKTVLHREDGDYCPRCSTITTRIMGVQKLHLGTNYCPYCGQALKWEENE